MLATTNRRMISACEPRWVDFALPYSQLFTTSKTEVNAIDFGVNYKFGAWSAVLRERALALEPALLVYKVPSAGHAGFSIGIDGGYGSRHATGTLTDATGTLLTARKWACGAWRANVYPTTLSVPARSISGSRLQ
jgi:hypothetical protein